MSTYSRLRQLAEQGRTINVAVVGAGLIGTGIVRQVNLTPAMRTALIVNRSTDRAVAAFQRAGIDPATVVVSSDVDILARAIRSGKAAVTSNIEAISALEDLDVVVEATGALEHGADVSLQAIRGGKHLVMMNAEVDATVGPRLKQLADAAGIIYTSADGDQPAVLKRMIDFVEGMGLEIVAAINCKGFMDPYSTPEAVRPWCLKQGTSEWMTVAMADGTKMNIENAVLANGTGLVPEVPGMHGIATESKNALRDCMARIKTHGVVDYTLGGDFGGAVFVIGYGDDPVMVAPYLKYMKMGDGPYYLFNRGFHLCNFETPLSIAEAVLDQAPVLAPLGSPVADVVAFAKRDLNVGEKLDGLGGYTTYGRIMRSSEARDFLPVGLTEHARVIRPVRKDQPIPRASVEIAGDSTLLRLWREQESNASPVIA